MSVGFFSAGNQDALVRSWSRQCFIVMPYCYDHAAIMYILLRLCKEVTQKSWFLDRHQGSMWIVYSHLTMSEKLESVVRLEHRSSSSSCLHTDQSAIPTLLKLNNGWITRMNSWKKFKDGNVILYTSETHSLELNFGLSKRECMYYYRTVGWETLVLVMKRWSLEEQVDVPLDGC